MSVSDFTQRWSAIALAGGLTILLAASLTLASAHGPKPSITHGHTLSLTLNEYSITPRTVSIPHGKAKLIVHNAGVLTHNLTVEHERLDSKGEPVIITSTYTIMPGQTSTASLPLLNAGRYALLSALANQADLGMTGTLIVR